MSAVTSRAARRFVDIANTFRGTQRFGTLQFPRWLILALCLGAVAFGVFQVASAWEGYWQHIGLFAGADYRIVTAAAERWLSGEGFYYSYQLAGPYDIKAMDALEISPIMYPPTMLVLLVPFTVLPAVLWWAVPLGVIGWALYRLRPAPVVWPVLVLLLMFPTTLNAIATGNPILWFTAALSLGTLYSWPAVLLLLKPTIAPFALIGIWRREWWIGAAALAAVSLLFLPMWFDYLTVLGNTRYGLGFLYSLNQWPMLFIPVLAWLGNARQSRLEGIGVGEG